MFAPFPQNPNVDDLLVGVASTNIARILEQDLPAKATLRIKVYDRTAYRSRIMSGYLRWSEEYTHLLIGHAARVAAQM